MKPTKTRMSLAQEFERTFIAVGVILTVLSVFIIDKQKYEALLFACLGGYSLASSVTSYAMRIHIRKFYVHKHDLTMEIARLINKHGTTDMAKISAAEESGNNAESSNANSEDCSNTDGEDSNGKV